MSLECRECEHDVRGGHAEDCSRNPVYRAELTPDATLEVEASGNVVLVTPARRITISNVVLWVEQLTTARQIARAADLRAEQGRQR